MPPTGDAEPVGSAASVRLQGVWAKGDDWTAARPIIKRLYQDEKKTLQDVMAIMETEHSFFATPKMYKTKFKEWGIAKKFKSRELLAVVQAMEDRRAAGKASRIMVRGREVDLQWASNYIRRNRSRIKRLEARDAERAAAAAAAVAAAAAAAAEAAAANQGRGRLGQRGRAAIKKPAILEDIDEIIVCRTPSPSPSPSTSSPARGSRSAGGSSARPSDRSSKSPASSVFTSHLSPTGTFAHSAPSTALSRRSNSPPPPGSSPSPGRVWASPSDLRPAEDLLRTINLYVDGTFSAGHWFATPDGICRSRKGCRGNFYFLNLWDRLEMAAAVIAKHRAAAETQGAGAVAGPVAPPPVNLVRLLDPAFVYLEDIVREEDPRAMSFLLGCFEEVYLRGLGDVVSMFVNHLAELSARIQGKNHPQALIWRLYALASLPPVKLSPGQSALRDPREPPPPAPKHAAVQPFRRDEVVERIFVLLLDGIRLHAPTALELQLGIFNDFCDAVILNQRPPAEQAARTGAAIAAVERRHGSRLASVELAMLRHRHCTVLRDTALREGRVADAEVAYDGLRQYGRRYGDWDGAVACKNRGEVRLKIHDWAAAEGYFRQTLALVGNKSLFRDEAWVSSAHEGLEEALNSMGRHAEAREAHRRRAEEMEKLQDGKRISAEEAQRMAESGREWMFETDKRRIVEEEEEEKEEVKGEGGPEGARLREHDGDWAATAGTGPFEGLDLHV